MRTLEEALQKAKELAPGLGAETDALNDAFDILEEAIEKLRLGVTADVKLADDGATVLGFGKLDQVWHLHVTYRNGSTVTLRNSSRELRLLAVSRIPELLVALVEEANRQISSVREARATVAALADRLQSIAPFERIDQ